MNPKLSTAAVAIVTTMIAPLASADVVKHFGMCDASDAVPISSSLFVVANDEDNILRVYQRDKSGAAIYSQDMNDFLQIDAEHPEADIEGATLIGKRVYWISSHSANKNSKPRPNRHRFFATDIDSDGNAINLKPVGTPFIGLIEAIKESENFKGYHLGKAAKQAPESEGGLNIEGLASTPEGHLLIGFRNPIPDKKALLVVLENPKEVIEEKAKPKLGQPILLDLGGSGIRSIEYFNAAKAYFIIAGPYNDDGDFQLYQWSGNITDAPQSKGIDFQGLNPEALIVYPEEKNRIQILSDDGAEKVNKIACKDLQNAQDKSFRSLWINL